MTQRLIVAIGLGLLLGLLCARVVLVDSAASLVPWALVGLAVGVGRRPRDAAAIGAAYGFSLSLAFMAFSYAGHAALVAVAGLDLALACFGGVCGAVLSTVGSLPSSRLRRPRRLPPADRRA